MAHHFIYEYAFESEGREILCHVYNFDSITDLEAISVFPHRERRELALKLMKKYSARVYHALDHSDIDCAFAVQLKRLFNDKLKVYWTNKLGITMLFYTGYIFQNPNTRLGHSIATVSSYSLYKSRMSWSFFLATRKDRS